MYDIFIVGSEVSAIRKGILVVTDLETRRVPVGGCGPHPSALVSKESEMAVPISTRDGCQKIHMQSSYRCAIYVLAMLRSKSVIVLCML